MKWEKLADGHEVLRLWKILPESKGRREAVPTQEKEPEIAILRLSKQKYNELRKSPKEFINNPRVFDKPVNSLDIPPEATAMSAGTGTRLLMVVHRPSSSAVAAAAPEFLEAMAA